MNILVVEDDPELGIMIKRMLMGSGHSVVRVLRGEDAITAALHQDFDLLLCDLMLPDIQGTDVIRALKAQAPHLPVIVMSALDPATWRDPCLDAGATGYIQKPIRLADLRAELALVEASRARLRVGLLDHDAGHRANLERALSLEGCEVAIYPSVDALVAERALPALLMLDAAAEGVEDAVRTAAQSGVPTFVFSEHVSAGDEERLMRAGAALCLKKPVDPNAVLIQARFLINA